MNRLKQWKRALYLIAVFGIIGLSTYGIYNTANAYDDFNQSQTSEYSLIINSSSDNGDPVPCGASCYPDGCAGCSGCIDVQYEQNTEALPYYTTGGE